MKLTFWDYAKNMDLLVPLPIIRLYDKIRHPVWYYRDWRKWRNRPSIGDEVEDCRGLVLKVVEIEANGDDLLLSDGSRASWMNCCDKPCQS